MAANKFAIWLFIFGGISTLCIGVHPNVNCCSNAILIFNTFYLTFCVNIRTYFLSKKL